MPLKKGDILGLYRVEEPLGAGGMGEVYRAWDPRLDRQVAIKVLPLHSPSSSALKRFQIEAKAVAALSHPNILVIHDVGKHKNRHYAVSELLEGETLRERLVRARLPWQDALRIAAAITDGLAAAHSKGVVHRDLKPENIFLTWDDRVKILDFGLAFFDVRLNPAAPASRPTPPGTVIGTSGYMSPEQFLGEEVDHRSDIFALGCLLYEMLTGEKAFPSRSIGEAVMSLLERHPPPISSLAPEIPPELEEVVGRCLAKEPDERFQLAAAIGTSLRRLEPDPDSSPGLEADTMPEPRAPVRALAVLPLADTGGHADAAYLSEGLSESIIRALSRQRELRVIAWGTSERYKDSSLPPSEIGRALSVDAVLTGRVLERDQRLIVTVELVGSRDGAHLWGERYDRRFTDVFAVQDEIATEISRRLHRSVTDVPVEKRLPDTESSEAWRLYLKGRYFWNRRSPDNLKRSRACFEQSLEEDPAFALAYTGLADTYNVMPFWGVAAPRDVFPRAKAAARRAVEIDPWLAEAHASAAYVAFYFDWDAPEADKAFRKALELQPNYATARQWYGVTLALRGDFEAAVDQLEKAQEIDPLSLMVGADRALVAYLAGRPEQAIAQCDAAHELDARFGPAHLYRGLALEQMGRFDDAAEALDRATELTGDAAPALAAFAHCSARAGERRQAERILAKLLESAGTRYVSPYPVALVYWGLEQRDQALAWLGRACEEKSELMVWFGTDPRFAGLRESPPARELLRKMNQ